MAITIECPFCNEMLSMNDFTLNQEAICPMCRNRVSPADLARRAAEMSAKPRKAKKKQVAEAATAIKEPAPEKPPEEPTAMEEADEDQEQPAPPRFFLRRWLRRLDPWTAGALFAGSLALLLPSVPFLAVLSKPVSGLGLLLALLGGVVPALQKQTSPTVPLSVAGLCLIALLFVGPWSRSRAPDTRSVTITRDPGGIPAHQQHKGEEWVDASSASLRQDGLRIEILAVQLGGVEIKDDRKKDEPKQEDRPTFSKEKYLVIKVRVTDEAVIFHRSSYQPWSNRRDSPSKHPPILTDDTGKSYLQETFDPAPQKVEGRGDHLFLTPGHQLRDVLVFPPPADSVKFLRLELPGSAFGKPGKFRFQIPRSIIQVTPQQEATPEKAP